MSDNENRIDKLEDENLEAVTGGYIHRNGSQWEVINDKTGTVMIRVSTK